MATSPRTTDASPKMFTCPEPSCWKSFAKREHLHRHQYNHKDRDLTCSRCAAHFRRRDLLDRHLKRHQQKDIEAGGEGRGNLATRKRLWRDSDGRVVNASRPRKIPLPGADGPPHSDFHRHAALPSPLTSSSGVEQGGDVTYLHDPWSSIDMSFVPADGQDPDFLSDSTWATHSLMAATASDVPDHDISFPDTTISFSAPLPTLQYYNWLFGSDIPHAGDDRSQSQSPTHSQRLTAETLPGPDAPITEIQDAFAPPTPFDATGSVQQTAVPAPSAAPPAVHVAADAISVPIPPQRPPVSPRQYPHPAPHREEDFDDLPPPDCWARERLTRLPVMTNQARDGLMQLIYQSRPSRPDKSEISPCDPLLSSAALQKYCDLFFTRFNLTYPLIHPGTFDSSKAPPLLLMSIVLLGATYADKKAHLLAVCIHDTMRPLIHSSKDFGTRPRLWMLQTILLVECFGKSRAGERQHDMSNLYHGLQINLLRRSECLHTHVQPWDERTQTLDEYWRQAVEVEQMRRLALISFMWDTQHAIFFAQILCMNASELKVTLPWDTAVWEAETAHEWWEWTRASPAPQPYLTILQMYTDPHGSSAPRHLNVLSRVLILHGLMSLSWDFRRRDQTALKNVTATPAVASSSSSSSRWQSKISACYTRWKVDFDRYTKEVLASLPPTASAQRFLRFTVAHSAVYHTAQILLEVEIADLQIHAGARHILGRPVSELDRRRSRSRLDEFFYTRDGGGSVARATWHAARLVRDGIRKLDNWNVDDMIHFPWCLYLATLTCWALYTTTVTTTAVSSAADNGFRPLESVMALEESDNEDSEWDSRTEMSALISALSRLDPLKDDTFRKDIRAVAAKYAPHGLLTCMVKHLGTVRWAVVREGMNVLKDLQRRELHGN